MPKVSIIVPVYNVARYVEQCARSLFEQTFEDIEYVFVDDCTPDNSMEIISKVASEYPSRTDRVKIVRHNSNMGLPTARKSGLESSSGDFIYNCDSDDWIEKDTIEKCYTAAVSENADIVRFLFSWEWDGVSIPCATTTPEMYDKDQIISRLITTRYDLTSLCDKLINRRLFIENDICFPKQNMHEDFALVAQLFYYSNKIYFLNESFYHYRYNTSSIYTDAVARKDFNTISQIVSNISLVDDFLKKKGLIDLRKELNGFKYKLKRKFIYPNLPSLPYWKLYITVFPEIFWTVFSDKSLPVVDRVKYYLTVLGIWPAPYILVQHLKKRINGR